MLVAYNFRRPFSTSEENWLEYVGKMLGLIHAEGKAQATLLHLAVCSGYCASKQQWRETSSVHYGTVYIFLTEKITIYCLRAQDMTRIVYCTQAGIFQTPNLSVTELHRHTWSCVQPSQTFTSPKQHFDWCQILRQQLSSASTPPIGYPTRSI